MKKRLTPNALRHIVFTARIPRRRKASTSRRLPAFKLEVKDWLAASALVISLFSLLVPNIIAYEARKQQHNQGLFTSFSIGRNLGRIHFEHLSHVKPVPSMEAAFKSTITAELSALGIRTGADDLKYDTLGGTAADPFSTADSLVALIQLGEMIDAYQGFDAEMLMRVGFWLELSSYDKNITAYGFPPETVKCGTWNLYEAEVLPRIERQYGLAHLSQSDCKSMTNEDYQIALNRDVAKIMVELNDRSVGNPAR